MTKKEFIVDIIDNVTVGGLLPMNVPLNRISKIIDNAVRKFRDKDDRATHESIVHINTANMGSCKIIDMPENIKAITRLEHTNVRSNVLVGIGGVDEFSVRYGGSENDMLSYVSREAYYQLVRSIGVRFMPYDFSEYTHKLILEGDFRGNLFAEVHVYIKPEDLYKMDDFNDYVSAKLTLDFCKANNFVKTKLIGGREIDFDSMREDAKEIIQKMDELWGEQFAGAILTD